MFVMTQRHSFTTRLTLALALALLSFGLVLALIARHVAHEQPRMCKYGDTIV